jgi:hypothetical protein
VQNTYFKPTGALEFRPEVDGIVSEPMLELVRGTANEPTRRLVALTVLALSRMLRYVALADRVMTDVSAPKRSAAEAYMVLSVVRSDARALTGYLRRRAGSLLAADYDGDVFGVGAAEVVREYPRLLARGKALRDLRSAVEGLAAHLRLELRRVFESDFPALHAVPQTDELLAGAKRGTAALRAILQNATVLLACALGSQLDGAAVFDDAMARRVLSERLRRDVWMFSEVVRAFTNRARSVASGNGDNWLGESPLNFVREFVAYFRAVGYPLLRSTDYPHVDSFVRAMAELHHADLLDVGRVAAVVEEAERFQVFLGSLFDAIGRRGELVGTQFDGKTAAESLRLYLAS